MSEVWIRLLQGTRRLEYLVDSINKIVENIRQSATLSQFISLASKMPFMVDIIIFNFSSQSPPWRLGHHFHTSSTHLE